MGSRSGTAVGLGAVWSNFTAWASATGLPAISVPVPTPGLPVGMQLMAREHDEDLCLLLAGVRLDDEVMKRIDDVLGDAVERDPAKTQRV